MMRQQSSKKNLGGRTSPPPRSGRRTSGMVRQMYKMRRQLQREVRYAAQPINAAVDWARPWQLDANKRFARELWSMLIFMTIFCMVSCRNLFDSSFFYFANAVKGQYLEVEMKQEHSPTWGKTFKDVETVEEYYHWLQGAFAQSTFDTNSFDGDSTRRYAGRRNYGTLLGHNKFLGAVRLSQVRGKPRQCEHTPPAILENAGEYDFTCYGVWHTGAFLDSWLGVASVDSADFGEWSQFDYTNASRTPPVIDGSTTQFAYQGQRVSMRSGTYVREPLPAGTVEHERSKYMSSYGTRLWNSYPSPTHAILFDPKEGRANATVLINDLIHSSYIDLQTKVLVVEAVLYNPMLDRVCYALLFAELMDGGGVITSAEFEVIRFWRHITTMDVVYDGLWAVLALFYINFWFEELGEMRQDWKAYWKSPMNYLQLSNIFFFTMQSCCHYSAVVFLPPTIHVAGDSFNLIKSSVSFTNLANAVQAINAFLVWFKLTAILSHDPDFGILTDTLRRALSGLSNFGVIFFIIFIGFAQAYALVFQPRIAGFRTLGQSVFTLIVSLLGDFDFEGMQYEHVYMGPLLFLTFVCLAVFVVLNMVIAIISTAYDAAVENAKRQRRVEIMHELKLYLVEGLVFPQCRATCVETCLFRVLCGCGIGCGRSFLLQAQPMLRWLLPMRPSATEIKAKLEESKQNELKMKEEEERKKALQTEKVKKGVRKMLLVTKPSAQKGKTALEFAETHIHKDRERHRPMEVAKEREATKFRNWKLGETVSSGKREAQKEETGQAVRREELKVATVNTEASGQSSMRPTSSSTRIRPASSRARWHYSNHVHRPFTPGTERRVKIHAEGIIRAYPNLFGSSKKRQHEARAEAQAKAEPASVLEQFPEAPTDTEGAEMDITDLDSGEEEAKEGAPGAAGQRG